MTGAQPTAAPGTVRNVSDTARWAAYFRAQETARPDALFRDRFAERLCGQHGVDIANTLPDGNKHAWAWVTRTYLFDHFIKQELQQGADLVLNLAAGLDARPYRLELPASLQWIEVDLPEILAYKEEILTKEKPTCALERVRLDLADSDARRTFFAALNRRAKKVLVLTEGLLIYLSKEGAPFKFAPAEGSAFFRPYGWEPVEVKAILQTAAKFKRPPFLLRLLARLPERKGPA